MSDERRPGKEGLCGLWMCAVCPKYEASSDGSVLYYPEGSGGELEGIWVGSCEGVLGLTEKMKG